MSEFVGWTPDGWVEGDPISLYSPQPRPALRALSWRWDVPVDCCCGFGVLLIEDEPVEMYCTCEAGKWRSALDSLVPVEWSADEGESDDR